MKDELGISLDKADDSILGTAAKVRRQAKANQLSSVCMPKAHCIYLPFLHLFSAELAVSQALGAVLRMHGQA